MNEHTGSPSTGPDEAPEPLAGEEAGTVGPEEQVEMPPEMAGEGEGDMAEIPGPDWEDPETAEFEDPGDGEDAVPADSTAPAPAAANGTASGPSRQAVAARRRTATARRPATGTGSGSPAPPVPDAASRTRRQVLILSVLTGVVVLIGVMAFVLSRGALDEGEGTAPATTPTSTRTAPTIPATDLQVYRDTETGFSVKYPKTWPKYVPPVGDIRLVVQGSEHDGFSVRILPIQTPATEENIGNFKAVTDAIVFGDQRNKLLQEQLVRLNGHLTYYYLYTFEDDNSRQQGVHAHYFVFEGNRMFSLVFQSVPADDFTRQAGIFDQIAESFLPEPARPSSTTTPAG